MRTTARALPLAIAIALSACQAVTAPSNSPEPTPPFTQDLPAPEIGVEYDYIALTHCGLHSLTIDGDPWLPVSGRPVERTDGTFAFNFDEGTVVLSDEDHAVYTSSLGYEVQIERWTNRPVPSGFGGGCM